MKLLSVAHQTPFPTGVVLVDASKFSCTLHGLPENFEALIGKQFAAEMEFDEVVTIRTIERKTPTGIYAVPSQGEIILRAQVRHFLAAGDGQGGFSLDTGIEGCTLSIDTDETDGLFLEIGEIVSLHLTGIKLFPVFY